MKQVLKNTSIASENVLSCTVVICLGMITICKHTTLHYFTSKWWLPSCKRWVVSWPESRHNKTAQLDQQWTRSSWEMLKKGKKRRTESHKYYDSRLVIVILLTKALLVTGKCIRIFHCEIFAKTGAQTKRWKTLVMNKWYYIWSRSNVLNLNNYKHVVILQAA